MRVAIVHESLSARGGAERVLEELALVFPHARIYALEAENNALFGGAPVTVSFLRRVPEILRRRRLVLPLYPLAPETFDLSASDVVISSSSAFAKGIVTRPNTLHVCYCHAPTRFLWDATQDILREFEQGTLRRGALQLILHILRLWDRAAAKRVDVFVANSETTKARIRKYYRSDATVIPPPVDVERFSCAPERMRQYFLFLGRLSPYKGARLAIQTFRKLELPLVVAGQGRELPILKKIAGPTITFRGFVPEERLPALYAGARAVVFPSDDDFGIVPVEALASGTPVLALRRGGATETIIEGVTGEFFDEPMEELLADCVRRFLEHEESYDVEAMRDTARKFSPMNFQSSMRSCVEQAWERWHSD